jgi:glutamine cyclotransferase
MLLAGLGGLVLAGGALAFCATSDRELAQGSANEAAVVAPPPLAPQRLTARVHAAYPHDPGAFTQGLVWDQGRLFESTGLKGRSSLREVDLESGEVRRRENGDLSVFAEGLALVQGELVQLTWREQRAFVWDAQTFRPVREVAYEGEGWGLCHDGKSLVMSDGSDVLQFRNPSSFAIERTLRVTREGDPQHMLNELECALGRIYANIWQSDEIVRIDPHSGAVDQVIDARALLSADERRGTDVLNGIAYVKERGRFLLTGKLWPKVFEVTFETLR